MKIDFSAIEGYETMSAEDKVKALEAFEYEDHAAELDAEQKDKAKYKDLVDKYTSQIAQLKKEANSGKSESEQQLSKLTEDHQSLLEEYEALKTEVQTAKLINSYQAMGYSEDLAKEKASAMIEGDTDKVLAAEEKYRAEIEKKIKADVIKSTGRPDDKGGAKKYTSREEILKIKDTTARREAIAANKELFGIE